VDGPKPKARPLPDGVDDDRNDEGAIGNVDVPGVKGGCKAKEVGGWNERPREGCAGTVKRSSRFFAFPDDVLVFFVGEGGAGRSREGILDVEVGPRPPFVPFVLELEELASENRTRPPPLPIKLRGPLLVELRAGLAGEGDVARSKRSSASSRSRCAAERTGDVGVVSMPLPSASFRLAPSINPAVLPRLLRASSVSPPRLIASAASAIDASMDETEDLCGLLDFRRFEVAGFCFWGLRGLPLAPRRDASVLAASCSRSAMARELDDFFFFFDVDSVDVEAFFWVLEYNRLLGLWLEWGEG